MKIFRFFAAIAALLAFVPAVAGDIIPQPRKLEKRNGAFTILTTTKITHSAELRSSAKYLAEYLPLEVQESNAAAKGNIVLKENKNLAAEAYTLEVGADGIVIEGGSNAGAFYGVETLLQLLPAKVYSKQIELPVMLGACRVADEPKCEYRGFMLDVARTWIPTDKVKRYIDLMAYLKLNKLHFHLTDDEGWRIEIKSHPELAKVGGFRGGDSPVFPRYGKFYEKWGGYYTQQELKEIVSYAEQRNIEVIPEIDMPGHMVAALATYPELGCTKGPYEVRKTWGVSKDVLCAGRESTFEFVEGVLEEVLALFPSKYIHIGGDEAPKHRWKECPDCQERIRKEGLKDEHELQSYFMKRVEKFLAKHGRSMIGWDEILEGGVSKTATVMAWRGAKRGILAAKLGNKVIMTPSHYCYMDYAQTSNRVANGEPICGGRNGKRPLSLRKVYSFDPYDQLNETERKVILGVQGNMWTEYVPNFDHVQHMILPRMAAIAEVGWSYGNKDYDDFSRRMHLLRKLYDKCGFKYAPYFFNGIE